MMSCPHLSCPACRIRVRANDPEIALLDDRCPICGATLSPVSHASDVMGFRCFDLDAFAEQEPHNQLDQPGNPTDLVSRREAALARDHMDAHRWSDDGGDMISEAVARWSKTR